MNTQGTANRFEEMLAEQVRCLQKMEQSETRRLALLCSDSPEKALSMQTECEEVFNSSVALQQKIDEQSPSIQIMALAEHQRKRIIALELLVRKLAQRNLELNQRCHQTLTGLMGTVQEEIIRIKKSHKAIGSYHNQVGPGSSSSMSGQL